MNDLEAKWDKLLKIKTSGRDDTNADQFHYPYEPTPYSVLERLANSGWVRKGNTLIDYGAGKGRVDFFLAQQTRCSCIGIEYDERIFLAAEENRKCAAAAGRVAFVQQDAACYEPVPEADRFYFFNPFSVEILRKVLARIRQSYYAAPRAVQLAFYYPSDEYISCLMTEETLNFLDEIDCRDLFDGDDARERILIFEME